MNAQQTNRPKLFQPLKLGELTLPNRVVMAPLTRMRGAHGTDAPTAMNARYYAQRASAGLIVTEATPISQQGKGYPSTPGIYTDAQTAGWKTVTDAVHAAGGRIFCQLTHVGRLSNRSHQPDGALPVSASAVSASGVGVGADWSMVPYEAPHALTTAEIGVIVGDFRKAAKNAQRAGFDGIELHGSGCLLDQFLQDGTNRRTDGYGGSIENRSRLFLEVVDAVSSVIGSARIGVRLSPFGDFRDMRDSDPRALFGYLLQRLSERNIAYAHLVESRASFAPLQDQPLGGAPSTLESFRRDFRGVIVSAGGYTRDEALAATEKGLADAIAFGRWFISNPDLPERLERNAELARYDRGTFYGGSERGYTDYPSLG